MEWQNDVNMHNVIAVGAQFGGPIALIRDKKKFIKVQSSGKPVIAIYSGSGKQLSSLVVSKSIPANVYRIESVFVGHNCIIIVRLS